MILLCRFAVSLNHSLVGVGSCIQMEGQLFLLFKFFVMLFEYPKIGYPDLP
jgi:hypothetical protein